MSNQINKKQILLMLIVFLVSFLLAREFFANWDTIKEALFGN
jgi:hypothetical protein